MNYNPMLDYKRNQLLAEQAMIQNQLNQINRNINASQFSPYPQQNQQSNFFVRQVGNLEEAKSFPVDPGIMYLFLDTASGRIYFKQLNVMNGKSDFYTYTVEEQKPPEAKPDPFQQINERLSNIEKIIGGLYDKSVSSTSSDEQSGSGYAKADAFENEVPKPGYVSENTGNDKRKK